MIFFNNINIITRRCHLYSSCVCLYFFKWEFLSAKHVDKVKFQKCTQWQINFLLHSLLFKQTNDEISFFVTFFYISYIQNETLKYVSKKDSILTTVNYQRTCIDTIKKKKKRNEEIFLNFSLLFWDLVGYVYLIQVFWIVSIWDV